jgi:transposase
VALAHGLNANLVHKWRRKAGRSLAAVRPTTHEAFVPVTLAQAAVPADVCIELRRGPTAIVVT